MLKRRSCLCYIFSFDILSGRCRLAVQDESSNWEKGGKRPALGFPINDLLVLCTVDLLIHPLPDRKTCLQRLLVETKTGTLENIQIVQYCWPGKPEEREGDEG